MEMESTAHRDTGGNGKPTLYVVATPIGNLCDITLRALDVLKSVDAIAAEDTRVTGRLLDHYDITARQLISLHEHNEVRVIPRLLALLGGGGSVAVVTDAGTPAISDPGARAVAAVRAAGHAVVPVPGPSAAIAAVSASGFNATRFLFHGFLPARGAERRGELQGLAALPFTLVFYEAPHRVLESVADICATLGAGRRVVIARELTKLFETVHECALGEAAAWIAGDDNRSRGEFVLVVEGAPPPPEGAGVEEKRVLEMLLAELPLKQAVSLATRLTGGRKNELYELALTLKNAP
jgi:16S rRNA (cytidine1402-2'-O)-methyltransferase